MSIELLVAKNCGFCVGVKDAVSKLEQVLEEHPHEKVYSLGMFIHNEQEIARLQAKGLVVVNDIEDVPDGSLILLPSHGSPSHIRKRCEEKRLRTVDLMCVYVRRLQQIAFELHRSGFGVVMLGDKNHPEVLAVKSLVPSLIVVDKEDVLNDNLSLDFKSYGIVSQTTQSLATYRSIASSLIEKNFPVKEVRVYNTVCWDVITRQQEVRDLAQRCDVVFVLGGKKSANTRRLYEIAKEKTEAYHVWDLDQVSASVVEGKSKIGIISGTSTPDWFVEAFKEKIERFLKENIEEGDSR